MNKNEIKKIILEEIKSALSEMGPDSELYPDGYDFGSPEEMAADSRPEEDDDITPPGIEDMSPDPAFGPDPSFVEEDLEEMARTANTFSLAQTADMKQVLQFMQRVNDKLKTYKSPGQKRPKKRFTPEEMKALAAVMVRPEGFTSKDVIAATSYNSPAQANKFLAALEQKGLIKLTSQLKKSQEPARDPNAPETRGRKRKPAEFDTPDDAMDMDMGDFEDLDLSGFDDIYENKTMTNLEKYIKQQIKEAKSPLASKMKEVETRGKIAALETKLAAVAEMIEETNGRLTRIDEDNEFADMMDKNAVKEVRKQLKELERAQAKLQKEYDKVSGGRKKEKVVDEVSDDDIPENPNDPKDHPALPESKKSLKENTLDPELKDELQRLVPDEWEGSWDDAKGDFVVPFEDTYMIDMEDVLDSEFWPDNINKVPTDWVLIDQFDLEDGRRPNDTYIAKNFARLVPGEGIEIKATTERGNGGGLNESILRMQKLAGLLKG